MKLLVFLIILSLLFYCIVLFINKIKYNDINRKLNDELNDIEGNIITKDKEEYIIKKLNNTNDNDAMSLYQSGMILDYYYGDAKSAQDYYIKSLENIKNNNPKNNAIISKIKNRLITDGIREYDEKQQNLPNPDIIQNILNKTIKGLQKQNKRKIATWSDYLTHNNLTYNNGNNIQIQNVNNNIVNNTNINANNNINNIIITNTRIKEKRYEKYKENIKDNVEWLIDKQNVHDHLLNDQMLKQYNIIKEENKKPVMNFYMLEQLISYIKYDREIKDIPQKYIDDSLKLIRFIRPKDQKITKLNNIKEEEYLGTLFNRALDSDNKKELICSLLNNMSDAWNNGHPVCVTGRITRYLSSFAHLDKNTNIGILLTIQALKNEIFEKSGKIQNEVLGKLSYEDRNKYNNDIDKILSENIDREIKSKIRETVMSDYSKIYHINTLEDILKEINDSL